MQSSRLGVVFTGRESRSGPTRRNPTPTDPGIGRDGAPSGTPCRETASCPDLRATGGGATRLQLAAGLALVAAGCFLSLDPAARLARLGDLLGQAWPFAAIALAGLLLLRAVPGLAARVLVVVLGASAAAGLGVMQMPQSQSLLDAAPSAAAALGVLLVVRSAPRDDGRSLTVLWGKTVRLGPGRLPPRTVVSCAAASVHVDASLSVVDGEALVLWVLFADIVLTVPSDTWVRLGAARTMCVVVRDRDPVSPGGPELQLEVTGLVGSLTVRRR